MRSRKTNMLQFAVLFSGVIFILIGIVFYLAPMKIISLFAENISENWLDLVRDHELVAPLYYISRSFSALLFTSGFLMIMPIFDPLKYRGIIWFNGVLFPLMAVALLGNFTLAQFSKKGQTGHMGQGEYGHAILLSMGILLFVLLLLNFSMLMLTRSDAKLGKE